MATPLALEEKADWYTCDTHTDLNRLCSEGWIWVSCKKIISEDRDFKCENTLPRLRALPIPRQFQVVKVMWLIPSLSEWMVYDDVERQNEGFDI